MRLRSPAEYYIKALVVHPDKLDTITIRERLLDEGLDVVSDAYIDKVRDKIKAKLPKPFYPTDANHAPSFRFLLNQRINRFFRPDDAMLKAKEILETPRAKEFAEAMILSHAPLTAIAAFMSKHRKVTCNVPALEAYKHYFWNIDLLDSTQMRVLLQLRQDIAVQHNPEFKDRKKILTTAYYKDARKVAADLPFSPTSAMLAQMRLGIQPTRAQIALRMMETRDLAWMRAIEAAQNGGPGDDQKFLNYVNGGRILEELLQLVAKPDDDLRKQLTAIALRTDTKPVPSIHALSAGQHTVEIAPIKDAETDDDEIEFQPGHSGGGT